MSVILNITGKKEKKSPPRIQPFLRAVLMKPIPKPAPLSACPCHFSGKFFFKPPRCKSCLFLGNLVFYPWELCPIFIWFHLLTPSASLWDALLPNNTFPKCEFSDLA